MTGKPHLVCRRTLLGWSMQSINTFIPMILPGNLRGNNLRCQGRPSQAKPHRKEQNLIQPPLTRNKDPLMLAGPCADKYISITNEMLPI